MKRTKIIKLAKLKEMGINQGDIVRILDYEFEYRD